VPMAITDQRSLPRRISKDWTFHLPPALLGLDIKISFI
jgi:hypothetical protein